jgi:hypothetical protein
MASVSMVSVYASKDGKGPIAKIPSAQMIVLAMVNVLSNRCIVLANALVTMVGEALVASGWPCTLSCRSARMIAQETVFAWVALVRVTSASRVQIAVIRSVQKG